MLVELLSYLIEKGFVRNEYKLQYYMDLYDSIKGSVCEQVVVGYLGKPDEEEKFTCKKFIRVFKQIAKKQYPSDVLGFENYVYKAMIATQHSQDVRLKLDDNVKKYLTRETINVLRGFQRELEIIFEIYLPQNFNGRMGFSWEEIRYLQKKLPIMGFYRFLWDCEIAPNYVSGVQYFEMVSKLIPAQSIMLAGANHKESLFYNVENILNYSKQAIYQKKMKLIEGDIGLNMFEMSILLIRISCQVTKQKNDFTKSLQMFLGMIKLK